MVLSLICILSFWSTSRDCPWSLDVSSLHKWFIRTCTFSTTVICWWLFAVYKTIITDKDTAQLQWDLDQLQEWATKWQLRFNVSKCTIMWFTKSVSPILFDYKLNNHSSRGHATNSYGSTCKFWIFKDLCLLLISFCISSGCSIYNSSSPLKNTELKTSVWYLRPKEWKFYIFWIYSYSFGFTLLKICHVLLKLICNKIMEAIFWFALFKISDYEKH